MRFLENLVTDLIKDASGLDPARAVRRLGGRRLLMMGGLAAAGTLAQQKQPTASTSAAAGIAGGSGSGYGFTKMPGAGASPGAPAPTVPPPPSSPGEPAAATLPPPTAQPAAPSASAEALEEIDAELPPHLVLPLVRTMVAAALADGRMAPEEKSAIESRLADSGLTAEDVERVHHDLVFPPTVDELAALVVPPPERELLFELACLVLRADAEISEPERAWLSRLGVAFEIPEDHQRALAADIVSDDAP